MQCRDFREIADSYLSDELLVETNHDVLAHLENCAECRVELAARRELRAKLRASFVNAADMQMSDEFAERLSKQLRAVAFGGKRPLLNRRRTWLAVAACLCIATLFGLVIIKERQHGREPATQVVEDSRVKSSGDNRNSPAAPAQTPDAGMAVNVAMTELSRFAVGDHRHCAVKFSLPEKPIALEEAGHKYDRAYLNLTQAVMTRRDDSSDGIELIESHSCVFEGRRFGHVVLRAHGHLVSFLVTGLGRPGASDAAQRQPKNNPGQQVIACSQISGYQVSCFETAHHAVFVVSDLSEAENLALARTLAPSVYEHLARAESLA